MADTEIVAAGRTPLLPLSFVARVGFVIGAVLLAALLLKLADLWILVFGAVVAASVFRAIAEPLQKRLGLSEGLSVFAALVILVALIGGVGYLFGRQIRIQVESLSQTLPHAWEVLQARMRASPLGARILDQAGELQSQANGALKLAPKFAASLGTAATNLVLVVVSGVYLATKPAQSREGVLRFFPRARRDRMRAVMNACGRGLQLWLKAQVVSMVVVGLLVGLGMWLLGVPSPLALGLLSGVAQFVPIVGPIASAVPGLILAATGGQQSFLLAGIVYITVSQLESNFITPMVQRSVASLPIVFTIFAVVGFGLLFGPLGIVFATPMAMTLYTLAGMLYLQDVLGEQDVMIPGQPGRRPRRPS